ncbi:PREDICTED: ecto-NOX disulfide-thiol exchanger 2 isoform X1 [Rhagoletis zephyria]|uniref:ecto-NOX disulfide-thiol exchanger 2 isoform X1 n=1 Tax=Rhagoletis zephyria TaxID=28612 RepID=UPI0008116C4C|nr:PREDICTED: ecto-NOX disulfide-thiol exchanger 2 isoform X1 [Rhagoletis zephyria]
MESNYGNLQNMLPLLGSIAGNGNSGNNNQNFINQLAAAISTAVGAVNAATTTPATTAGGANTSSNSNERQRTPEPPPAPRFRLKSPTRIKPNRGTAPMDIENESETEHVNTVTKQTANTSMPPVTDVNMTADKLAMGMPNMFMNGFMPPNMAHGSGINATPYMFYQTSAPTNAASTSAAAALAANQMFMDPTTMLAAMQQMQQTYNANFGAALPNAEGGVNGQLPAVGATGAVSGMKEVIKTKNCILFPPNPSAPPPTTRERPPGCRTVFVGGLPENSTEELIREIFESCGEITTLRASKKNFCHIRYRHEASVDRAIYLSGYRVRISNTSEPANFGRLHVDYAQARDDLYDFECKQRQLQREQRHRERLSTDRLRSQSPPPIPHYNDHEASLVAEHLRSGDTFVKAVQTIAVWLERGDCKKHNANMFYSMIQSTHAHVRRLHTDKQQLEDDLRKARESYRKQMLIMSAQFTQIEKVFSAASHKKVWDHFTKAQRKNIDQWKKLALELRSVQIEDDEMEMSDDDRNYQGSSAKRTRYDAESLKEENDSLRCQLEALRSEMSHVRTDIKYDNDYRDKQIKVLQETIRNMQTQLLQTKMREQKDTKTIVQLERKLKEAGVKQLLLKTRIKETANKRRDRETASVNSETSEIITNEAADADDEDDDNDDDDVEEVEISEEMSNKSKHTGKERPENANGVHKSSRNLTQQQSKHIQVIDIDDEVNIIEDQNDVVEIHETDEDEKTAEGSKWNDIDERQAQKSNSTQNVQADKIEENEELQQCAKSDGDNNNLENGEEKESTVPVETKLMEDSKEIEPKYLPFVEAQIIALIAAYLIVHPFGVSTESICVYLRQSMKTLDLQVLTLEQILTTYTNLFKMECQTADGGDDETKVQWKFCGFTEANDVFKEENETANAKNGD